MTVVIIHCIMLLFPSPEDIERAEQLKNEGMSDFPSVFRPVSQNALCVTKWHLSSHLSSVIMQIKTEE